MQVSKFFQFLSVCVLIIGLSACDQGMKIKAGQDAALAHIPSEVSSVTTVNVGRLLEKADFKAIQKMEFFKEAHSEVREENPALAEIMLDPYQSGIDLNKNAYSTINIDPNDPEQMFTSVTLNLSDAKLFEEMLANAGLTDVADKGTHKQIMEGNSIIAWNDEIAVIGGGENGPMLWQGAAKHFSTTKEQSIVNNKDLQKALSGQHDITSWLSSDNFADNDMAKMALSMLSIDPEALKDNAIHSYTDFENGIMKSASKYYLQKGLTKDFDLFFKDEVKTDFSPYIPNDNLVTAMTNALDVKGIKQVLKERPQYNSMVNFALKEQGLTLDDITGAFDGDLMLAVIGDKADPKGIFATRINDASLMGKLLTLAIDKGLLEDSGDGTYTIKGANRNFNSMAGNPDGYLLLKDDMLFATGDQAILETLKNGGFAKSDRISKDKLSKLKGNIFSGFLDFTAMQQLMGEEFDLPLNDMEFTTDRKQGLFEARFEDENTNSLKQLFELINKVYLENEKNKSKVEEAMGEDTEAI